MKYDKKTKQLINKYGITRDLGLGTGFRSIDKFYIKDILDECISYKQTTLHSFHEKNNRSSEYFIVNNSLIFGSSDKEIKLLGLSRKHERNVFRRIKYEL